ncbi:MAG: RHS repeat-associated core domain-containing protein [Kofleriaceae bacterium]
MLADANNNTVMLLGSTQATLVSYTYDPYGVTTADVSLTNTQQSTGRENDNPGNAQGLYYYRARYYMPGIGRFIAEDPIGWASGQTNNYAYAGGDPINARDPRGLDTKPDDKPSPGPNPAPPPPNPPPPATPPTPAPPSPPTGPTAEGKACRAGCWGGAGVACDLMAGGCGAGTLVTVGAVAIPCGAVLALVCGAGASLCSDTCPL